jgi:hypothetical protein
MANKYRAELPFEIDGKTYTLRLSQNDIVGLEGKDELGQRALRFLANLQEVGIGLREALLILRRGLMTGSNMTIMKATKTLDDLPFTELSGVAISLLSLGLGLSAEEDKEKKNDETHAEAQIPDPLLPVTHS